MHRLQIEDEMTDIRRNQTIYSDITEFRVMMLQNFSLLRTSCNPTKSLFLKTTSKTLSESFANRINEYSATSTGKTQQKFTESLTYQLIFIRLDSAKIEQNRFLVNPRKYRWVIAAQFLGECLRGNRDGPHAQ